MSQSSTRFTKFSENPQTTDTIIVVSEKTNGYEGIKSPLYVYCMHCVQRMHTNALSHTGLHRIGRTSSHFTLQITNIFLMVVWDEVRGWWLWW